MSHIKRIRFASVGKNEGCTCDRCGQYIKNIWSVDYAEGFTVNYGLDCWEKVYKSGKLSQYGEKEMKKAMKKIKEWQVAKAKWQNGEMDCQENEYYWQEQKKDKLSPWYDKTFAEYKEWMIKEFIQYRIECAQKELKKFSKINFND